MYCKLTQRFVGWLKCGQNREIAPLQCSKNRWKSYLYSAFQPFSCQSWSKKLFRAKYLAFPRILWNFYPYSAPLLFSTLTVHFRQVPLGSAHTRRSFCHMPPRALSFQENWGFFQKNLGLDYGFSYEVKNQGSNYFNVRNFADSHKLSRRIRKN